MSTLGGVRGGNRKEPSYSITQGKLSPQRARDNQDERGLRAFRRREGGARPEAERPQKSA
jgi:hypothetical protein